jgi:hypothetical protein
MSRSTWPEFGLFLGTLNSALHSGVAEQIVQDMLPGFMTNPTAPDEMGMPVALRWVHSPFTGFPRQPFKVYRREPEYGFESLCDHDINVQGFGTVGWDQQSMYMVRFEAEPDPGETLVADALDEMGQIIPGQRIVFSHGIAENGIFRCPHIAALQAIGQGVIRNVEGINQYDLVNATNWELIDTVGLPFESGQIASEVYDSEPQGFEPAGMSGFEAATVRLDIAIALHQDIPPTRVTGIPTPQWPPPDQKGFLEMLCASDRSILEVIRDCLESTYPASSNWLQWSYKHEASLEGVRQADIPDAEPGKDEALLSLPVVGTTLLAVSSENYAAVALGYGTHDFPPQIAGYDFSGYRMPPNTVLTPFDYMVTAPLDIPWDWEQKSELAALAWGRPPAEPPVALTADRHHQGRPVTADAPASEAVRVAWELASFPQAYAVVRSRQPGHSEVLNSRRPLAEEYPVSYEPYVPIYPTFEEGAPVADHKAAFADPVLPLPITGSQEITYLLAGTDVFGRWSDFRQVRYTAEALAIIRPGLHSAALEHGAEREAGTRRMAARIEIEFSWDWSDRSLDHIEFTGGFYEPEAERVPEYDRGFALEQDEVNPSKLVVDFQTPENPVVLSPHHLYSGVEVLEVESDPPGPPDPDRRRYRLTVAGLICDYTSAQQVAYAVYARAAELIRPQELSERVGPVKAFHFDPLSPDAPGLPDTLQWAALPDATGRARGLLRWDPVPHAAGYVVWEATEATLWRAMGSPMPPTSNGISLLRRADAIREKFTEPGMHEDSMLAFSRLNTDLLRTNQVEVVLPGAANTVYAYRVSSVSGTGVESPRSMDVALFAVPHRNQPGQPRLILRPIRPTVGHPSGIQVIALPGLGAVPAGYRVFRVRNPALIADVGGKGPPVIAADDSHWAPKAIKSLDGLTEDGQAILDPVPPSWYPYYYQIVAVGQDDPDEGEHGGESLPSAVQAIFLPPLDPIRLELVSLASNDSNQVVTFRTDLPVKQTALGVATIQVMQVAPDAAGHRMERTQKLACAAHQVPTGPALELLLDPLPEELDPPEINRRDPDGTGLAEYTVRMSVQVAQGVIVARDPLGRSVQVEFSNPTA